MFRSAPQAVHTVVPEQAVVPICVPEQCMLVLSVAGTWRSDWRHVLASMANTKHTAPVGRPGKSSGGYRGNLPGLENYHY